MRKFRLVAGVAVFAVLMLASTSCGSPAGLLSIAVIPADVTLRQQGSTVQFIANGVFERGPDQDITSRVTWASALPSVATVNSSGLATAVAFPTCLPVNTTITASLQGKTAIANLSVTLAGTTACP
ncbi:MAG: Ig-like domain-containing protein [Acidobacteria bacterium]|nr:Ig-like domain-containing protein [Acidobacteriota bacterium]